MGADWLLSVSVVYLRDGVAEWELPLTAQYHKSVYHIGSLGKEQNSQFEVHLVNACRFCTIIEWKIC